MSSCMMQSQCADKSFCAYDPWRITVKATSWGLSGFDIEDILQAKYDVYPELSTHQVDNLISFTSTLNLVCVFPSFFDKLLEKIGLIP